jgi:hypothetical protein
LLFSTRAKKGERKVKVNEQKRGLCGFFDEIFDCGCDALVFTRALTVNMRDIAYLISRFNTKPAPPNWNPNTDVNSDGVCNMRDIAIAILNFNKHE